jgi:hypothetical protein
VRASRSRASRASAPRSRSRQKKITVMMVEMTRLVTTIETDRRGFVNHDVKPKSTRARRA